MQARPITAPTRCANARKPLCSLSNLCSDLSQTFEAEVQQTVTIATALDFALLTRNCYALSGIQVGLTVRFFASMQEFRLWQKLNIRRLERVFTACGFKANSEDNDVLDEMTDDQGGGKDDQGD